ncbi:hypothetical protein HWI79_1972 [Cryptosporidium felis]|nr:hypothetical protein HWI79_1972 [Cryptosporidium felis]
MEDDLVEELVAAPLSAEEIAAKLSTSKLSQQKIVGGREVGTENKSGVRGTDIFMGGAGVGSNMGLSSGLRNENKISNDWWSDGEDEDSNNITEDIINTSFFTGGANPTGNEMIFGPSGEKNIFHGDAENLYFDENMEEISFQGNDSNNNQLQRDNWDKEFLDNYKDDKAFDFPPVPQGSNKPPVTGPETLFETFEDGSAGINNYPEWNQDRFNPILEDGIGISGDGASDDTKDIFGVAQNADLVTGNSNYPKLGTEDNFVSETDFGNFASGNPHDQLNGSTMTHQYHVEDYLGSSTNGGDSLGGASIYDKDAFDRNNYFGEDNGDRAQESDIGLGKETFIDNFDYPREDVFTFSGENRNHDGAANSINLHPDPNSYRNSDVLDDFDDIFNNSPFVSSDNNPNNDLFSHDQINNYNADPRENNELNILDFDSPNKPGLSDFDLNSASNKSQIQPAILFD